MTCKVVYDYNRFLPVIYMYILVKYIATNVIKHKCLPLMLCFERQSIDQSDFKIVFMLKSDLLVYFAAVLNSLPLNHMIREYVAMHRIRCYKAAMNCEFQINRC